MVAAPSLFYFVRHGETAWNSEGRLQGKADVSLNETGRAQAEQAASLCASLDVDLVYTSPLLRARETAEIINRTLQVPLYIDSRLEEQSFGVLEGLTAAEIDLRPQVELFDLSAPLDLKGRRIPLQSELFEHVAARALAVVEEALEQHKGKTILFVAHGAWFRALVYTKISLIINAENAVPYACDFKTQSVVKV